MIETTRESFYRKKNMGFTKGFTNTAAAEQQQSKPKPKPAFDTISIINDYTKKSGAEISGVKKLENDKHQVWIYRSSAVNALWCTEERLHFLIIKQRWNQHYGWSDGRKSLERTGIAIPLSVYEFVASRKNYNNYLIICIINDANKWMYDELEKHTYYSITLDDMHKFAKRHYTIHDDEYGNEVIGFPFSLFKKI